MSLTNSDNISYKKSTNTGISNEHHNSSDSMSNSLSLPPTDGSEIEYYSFKKRLEYSAKKSYEK